MKVLSNNMFGLHRRQTYEELVGEIGKPLLNAYPDRKAINLRFSNWLTQLDAEGVKTMEQQQLHAMKEQEKQNLLREYSMSTGTSHAVAKASVEAPSETFHDPREIHRIYQAGQAHHKCSTFSVKTANSLKEVLSYLIWKHHLRSGTSCVKQSRVLALNNNY